MYALKFSQSLSKDFRGLLLLKQPIRNASGILKNQVVIGIRADYSAKDTIKAFCEARGGGWLRDISLWYVPCTPSPKGLWEVCKSAIDSFGEAMGMGGIYLSIEVDMTKAQKDQIQSDLTELIEKENGKVEVASEAPTTTGQQQVTLIDLRWIDDSDPAEGNGDEGCYQAIALLENGKKQKILALDYFPGEDPIGAVSPRHLLAEDGKRYWAFPAGQYACWVDLIYDHKTDSFLRE